MVTGNDMFSLVEEHNMESEEDGQNEKATGDEQKAVLSQEQVEEVSRKLESLEEHVKKLQVRMVWWMAERGAMKKLLLCYFASECT